MCKLQNSALIFSPPMRTERELTTVAPWAQIESSTFDMTPFASSPVTVL